MNNKTTTTDEMPKRSPAVKKGWLARNFTNDKDGFSARDFMMTVFTIFYIVQHIALLVLSSTIGLNEYTMEVADNANIAFIAIIAGVFSVDAAGLLSMRRQR